MGFWRQPLL